MKRVVVTRPAAEAGRWVEALQAQAWAALPLPLLLIEPVAPPVSLPNADAWMFVSPAAVRHGLPDLPPPVWPRCWAPGPATALALRAAGVPPDAIDQPLPDASQYDSEALWSVVQNQVQAGHRLWVVRGDASAPPGPGREALWHRCRARGGEVGAVVVYRRLAPVWGPEQTRVARQALTDGSVWWFSSSEALVHLPALLPGADFSAVPAVVTHPRIAATARRLGFAQVACCRPEWPELFAHFQALGGP